MVYVIESDEKDSWFQMWTGIGPCFTEKRDEAMVFTDKDDAIITKGRHSFAFTFYNIVEVK